MNDQKLSILLERSVADGRATDSAGPTVIDNRPELFASPAKPGVFAQRAGAHRRYLTEWLRNQVANGSISYDAASDESSPTDEQALRLANPNGPDFSPVFLLGLGLLRASH